MSKYIPTLTWCAGIAFIGSEGSGKTTLIDHLSKYLPQVPIIKGISREAASQSGGIPVVTRTSFEHLRAFQEKLDKLRRAAHSHISGPFIEDRSPIDSYAYTLAAGANLPEAQEWLQEFANSCSQYLFQMYQFVFILPSDVIPLEPDGVRNILPANASMMNYMIQGITNHWGMPHHLITTIDIESRVKEVLLLLEALGYIRHVAKTV